MAAKKATRDRLVETARILFWEQGYADTGITQILQAADAGSGSLYYFFPTKEDLIKAVLQWYQQNLDSIVVQPVFERVRDPIERIFGILDGYRRQLEATRFERGCPVGNLALELGNKHPAVRRLVADNFKAWCKVMEGCLADAGHRLPASVKHEQLALFVLTTMEGAVMLARALRSIDPYDFAITQLREYFERLLRDGTQWSRPSGRSAKPRRARRARRK